jgi:hypothetical protein
MNDWFSGALNQRAASESKGNGCGKTLFPRRERRLLIAFISHAHEWLSRQQIRRQTVPATTHGPLLKMGRLDIDRIADPITVGSMLVGMPR